MTTLQFILIVLGISAVIIFVVLFLLWLLAITLSYRTMEHRIYENDKGER